MSKYWQERMIASQDELQKRTIKQTEAQLANYYKKTMKRVIADFEALYDKLLATMEEGKEPTVADLYKLDKYWSMQGQLRDELQKLGELEAVLLSKQFEQQWKSAYKITEQGLVDYFNTRADEIETLEPIIWPPDDNFSTISSYNAQQMINQVWCADGKSWSDRVWGNVKELAEVLNDKLIDSVVTGKSTKQLTKELQERFNVSFSRANTLVRTETAHITTQAAAQRYKDYGLEKYEILGREEETGCNHSIDCHKMDGKVFLYSEMRVGVNAPPFHPNCRCAIAPVVDLESEKNMEYEKCKHCGKLIKAGDFCQDCTEEAMKWQNATWWTKRGASKAEITAHYFLWKNGDETTKQYDLSDKYFTYAYEKYLKEHPDEKDAILREIRERENRGIFGTEYSGFNICADCGKAYKAFGRNNNSKRCPECQEKYRKAYKAAKERERRMKKKLNKK